MSKSDHRLEFLADSDELKAFMSELKWVAEIPFTRTGDEDWSETDWVFLHENTGRLYAVSVTGRSGHLKPAAYHRNFLKSEPRVVNFHEVEEKKIIITTYEHLNERH